MAYHAHIKYISQTFTTELGQRLYSCVVYYVIWNALLACFSPIFYTFNVICIAVYNLCDTVFKFMVIYTIFV